MRLNIYHLIVGFLWTESWTRRKGGRRMCTAFGLHSKSKSPWLGASKMPHVIVVGGGVGGMALASRLAKSFPCNITIIEKNARAGGRSGSVHVSLTHGNFRHESGPSLLLLPHVYQRLFEECGVKNMEEYGLVMKPCIPAYQAVFEDGDRIDVGFPRQTEISPPEQEKMKQAEKQSRNKMDSFEKDGSLKWDAYLKACEAYLDCGLPNFIEEKLDLASFPAFVRESLQHFGKGWPLKPHSDVLDAFFESNKLKALASFQDLYVGLEPYRNDNQPLGGVLDSTAPAVFGLLSAIELHPTNKKCGVFAPMGGFQKVSDSLLALAEECGVKFRTGTVSKVAPEGVWYHPKEPWGDDCESIFEPADLIIINADLPYATQSLVRDSDPDKEIFDWDDGYRFSSGVIAFHWSLDKSLDELNTHNVFLFANNRTNMESSWSTLRDPSAEPSSLDKDTPFNFYVHRASKTDPSAAPEGMDSIMVLVPCPTLKRNADMFRANREDSLAYYESTISKDTVDAVREAVLYRLSVIEPDLQARILHEFVDTPATYARDYHVAAGTPFGLSHGLGQLSLMRPGADTGGNPNILYVGAGSRPGNGVPLVLMGAELVVHQAHDILYRRFALP